MKLLGIVGSPRKDGNSYYLVRETIRAAEGIEPSLDTEILQLADLNIASCRACESCGQEPYRCIIDDDDFGHVLGTMKASDGIIIAAPRYGPFGVCPSKMQAVLERLMNVSYLPSHTNPSFVKPLKGKPCGLLAVSVEGRQNNLPVLHSLEQYVLALGMQVVHAEQWPWVGVTGKGNEKGDVLKDDEAMKNARGLGRFLVSRL